ncbi:MAG TPA: glutamate--tRNA ligase [Rhodothermales bacterium]|nr:glutamate--tRNA ligase [Rhodothermales bacterium]
MSEHPVRVRFAPSPTGLLHIGGLRTALYNYLFAKQHGGTFILRIEDTDQTRFVAEAEGDIIGSLHWAGLHYDEGPGVGGPHAPYRQSERQALYRNYAQRLLDAGLVYYAFDTEEEIEAMRQRLRQSGNAAPKYDAVTRTGMKNAITLPEEDVRRRIEAGEPHVIRMKVPPGETMRIHDLIRGWVSFDTSDLDDQVLIKSDGMPTYHLASVVDDHLMEITHVIRGEEWLPSTPKHFLLYQFFGWQPPSVAHLPLIMSPHGGKLSKRNADELGIPISVKQYHKAGYEPQALLNFLAFLGWNPGTEQEVFTLEELVPAFSIERVGSSGVQFNLDKLRWYNQQFIRRLSPQELADRARPFLHANGFHPDEDYLVRVAALMQERLVLVGDLAKSGSYFFEDPETYDPEGVKKRWKENSDDLLSAYADRLAELEPFDAPRAEEALRSLSEEKGVGGGKIIHPVRLALSGVTVGPGLFEMMEVLGKETCLRRIRRAIQVLG